MKLSEIAARLSCEIEGDADAEIHGVAGIEHAKRGELTFVSNPRYRQAIRTTAASAVLVGKDVAITRAEGHPPLTALRSANPYLDFARAAELFYSAPRYLPNIHPTAVIAATAHIGEGAHVGPYCFIDENAHIGRNAVLHSFVSIYRDARVGDDFFAHAHAVVREGCRIGDRVTLQNGAIIGGDGFGFARDANQHWHKIPQAGITVLEDDVEVQANSCIDRATLGETLISRGVKIDDLVLVGHGGTVGEDTIVCGQAGLAGTTRVGKGCMLGGQTGLSGHLSVGDGAMLTPQSGVAGDIPAGQLYSGAPAVENRQWMKNSAALNHLPDLLKTVRRLEAQVERLKAEISESAR